MQVELVDEAARDRLLHDAAWIPRHVPDAARAVLIGGNGFRTASMITRLELELGRPVLTANQVLLWYLLQPASRTLCDDGSLFAR